MTSIKAELDTTPTVDLITRDEAKRHIRRDDSDDDDYIDMLISVIMSHLDGVDGILGRALLQQTWIEKHEYFPAGDEFRLALAPLISVDSIQYYDEDNALQTLSASDYSYHNGRDFSFVGLGNDASWPTTYDREDAVIITSKYGYGTAASDVPATIKHAGLLLLGHWYENREAVLVGTISGEIPAGVSKLLRPFIRPHF